MAKKYAVVIDFSPSEQIEGSDKDFKVMSLVVGLRSAKSFEKVGSAHADPEHRLSLKKWSGSSKRYRRKLVAHLHTLTKGENVILGRYIANDPAITAIGATTWRNAWGSFPKSADTNLKGKTRVWLEGKYFADSNASRKKFLINDLIVVGWIAEAFIGLWQSVVDINEGESIKLDVITDKLSSDTENWKAKHLRATCLKLSNSCVNVVGVPEISDFHQRDLLADNICGLFRELVVSGNPKKYGEVESVFKLTRHEFTRKNRTWPFQRKYSRFRFVTVKNEHGEIRRIPRIDVDHIVWKPTSKSSWRRAIKSSKQR